MDDTNVVDIIEDGVEVVEVPAGIVDDGLSRGAWVGIGVGIGAAAVGLGYVVGKKVKTWWYKRKAIKRDILDQEDADFQDAEEVEAEVVSEEQPKK